MSKKREMIIKRGDSTFDKILAHHRNPEAFELSAKEEEILARWRKTFHYQFNHYSKVEIVAKLEKEFGLSTAQAYADVRNAEALFGSVMESNKEFERALYIAGIKDFIKRCVQKGDRTNEAKARLLLGKYGDFSAENDPQFNPEKLENPDLKLVLDERFRELINQMTTGGLQDFNKLNIVDVQYEELADDAEEVEGN